jgi:hypothetical protein
MMEIWTSCVLMLPKTIFSIKQETYTSNLYGALTKKEIGSIIQFIIFNSKIFLPKKFL